MAKIRSHRIFGGGARIANILCGRSHALEAHSCGAIFNQTFINNHKSYPSVTVVTDMLNKLFTPVSMGGANDQ